MQDQASNNTAAIASFIENVQAAVDFQDPVEIKAETELASLPEWDSLAALGVIVMFDMEYGKTITGNDLKNCTTIADLFALLG
jgi:acyl carrier protein